MPNWCDNVLTIRAKSSQDLADFLTKYFTGAPRVFNFEHVVPEPQRKKDCPKDFWVTPKSHVVGDKSRPWFNWYDWHCAFWGTKWDIDNIELPFTEADAICNGYNELELYFATAWSPAIPICEALIEQNPHIYFSLDYYECGMCFAGTYDAINGDCEVDSANQEEWRKFLIDKGFETQEYFDELDAEEAAENGKDE